MTFNYPPAHQGNVVDDFHGTPVSDPYRWLEDTDRPDTQAWGAAQREFTEAYLAGNPHREAIRARLTGLFHHVSFRSAFYKGEYYFFFQHDGVQSQPVLYRQKGLNGTPHVALDPNLLSADGTVALTGVHVNKKGTLLAYGLSRSGSDQQEIHVRNLDSGQDYPEALEWCRFGEVAWKGNDSGFYYDRYPAPGGPEDPYQHNRLYWHTLGTPQSSDRLVFEQPDQPDLNFPPQLTEDGRYLLLNVWHGAINRNRVYYRDEQRGGEFVHLIPEPDASYEFVGNVGSRLYFLTDKDASRGRIIAIDVNQRNQWSVIIPEQADTMVFARQVSHHLAVSYLHDASHRLFLYDEHGKFVREIELPVLSTFYGLQGQNDGTELIIVTASFLLPPTIYRYTFAESTLTVQWQTKVDFQFGQYETRQVFYTSRDGTRVPMFLTHRRDIALDGDHPALLYGYGGYSANLTPSFDPGLLWWLEQGGVFAMANLRGGAEYGEMWHQAGMLDRKQTVFDDFIAAAEWLIRAGYTRPERLTIEGGSNGGLLVAACMLQRPDLFGAVLCHVPVTDMLRYHRFTSGRYWLPEYGNPDNPEHFAFLYKYSPLHNVKSGGAYPPVLIFTADHDDRVMPLHALKFAATLQASAGREHPVLLRVETKAGHGSGKPLDKQIAETTDAFTFLDGQFGAQS